MVVAAAAAGVSYIAANQAARLHGEIVQGLQRMETVTVYSDHFDRGLMASQAEIHIEVAGVPGEWLQRQLHLAGLEDARARFGLRLNVELSHGPDVGWNWLMDGAIGEPIVALAVSALTLDQETASDLAAALGEVPPVTFMSDVRLSGAHQTSVVWEATDLSSTSVETPWTAEWRGLDGLLVRTADGTLDGHLTGAGFDWRGETGHLAVAGFDFEIQGASDGTGSFTGDVHQRWRDVEWTPAIEDESDPPTHAAEAGDGWAASDLRIDYRATRELDETNRSLDIRLAGGTLRGVATDSAKLELRFRDPPEALPGTTHRTALTEVDEATSHGFEFIYPWLTPGLTIDPFRAEIGSPTGTLLVEGQLRVDPEHPAAGNPLAPLDALVGEIKIDARGDLTGRLGFGADAFAALAEAGLSRSDSVGTIAHFSIRDGEYREPGQTPIVADLAGDSDPDRVAESVPLEASAETEDSAPPDAAAASAPAPVAVPDSLPAAAAEDVSVLPELVAPVVPIPPAAPTPAVAPMTDAPKVRPAKRAEAAEDAFLAEMVADSDAADVEPEAPTQPEAEATDR